MKNIIRSFNEILIEICNLRKNVELLSNKVEVTISSMSKKYGINLEKTVLKILKKLLEAKGIEHRKIEKFIFKDENGLITDIKVKIIDDVDILNIEKTSK